MKSICFHQIRKLLVVRPFFFGKKQENQQFHEKNIHKDILFVACKFLKIKLGEILSMNQCLPNAKTINQTPF